MTRQRLWLVVAVVALLLAGGAITRRGRSTRAGGEAPPPRVKWSVKLPNGGDSTPAMGDDGTVFVGTTNALVAISPRGTIDWVFDDGASGVAIAPDAREVRLERPRILSFGPPTIARDGRLYVMTATGTLYCLFRDGSLAWKADIGSFTGGVPVVVDDQGHVILQAERTVEGRSAADGHPVWKTYATQVGVPVLARDGTVVTGGKSGMMLLTPRGEITAEWKPLEAGGCTEPAIGSDGRICAVCADKQIHLFSSGLQPLREAPAISGPQLSGPPAMAADGSIFYMGYGQLHAFTADLQPRWTINVPAPATSPLLAADGTILLGGRGWRSLIAVGPDGKQKWEVAFERNLNGRPGLAPDGTLYVGTELGGFQALEGGMGGLMKGGWPKYRADAGNSGVQPR